MRQTVRQVVLPGSEVRLPVIGQGTWTLGEDRARRAQEVEALRLGFSLGMTLVNTAELYGAGGAESVVGEAIRDCREKVFVVTKVWPSHARREAVRQAVEGSLRRLGTDYLDAVLLHWPTRSVPLRETLDAFAALTAQGRVRYVGVSNFNRPWLERARQAAGPGLVLSFNEVPYHLADRRVERSVLSLSREAGQVVLAYSPLGHGRLERWNGYPVLASIAEERGVTPAEVALAWVVRQPGVIAIPKAVRPEHVRANARAGDLVLAPSELAQLEAAFPPARGELMPEFPPYGAAFAVAYAGTRLLYRRGLPPGMGPT